MTAAAADDRHTRGMEEQEDAQFRPARSPFSMELQGVSAWYGRILAIRDLSLHVPRGSIYGLVGPSGAGKSTAIRILATVQQPAAGSVLVDGIDAQADPTAVRGRIGYLPDVAGVYEGLTVTEYLDFYGSIHMVPARRRRQLAGELLELIGLLDRRNDPVRQLSRGMKQLLGLARCLIHDPQILLLDEPAAGLDPRSRLDLRDILRELARFHKTVLIGSNMLSELAEVCTHLGVLRAGELVAEGSRDDIVDAAAPGARLRVRLLDPRSRDAALDVLRTHPACGPIEVDGESALVAPFSGTEGDLAAILEHLGRGGAQVTEFALDRSPLEEIVLRMTETRDQG